MRTNYSAIETFEQCPKKYKFRYIDNIPELKTKEQLFGTHLHETLRFLHSSGPHFPTLEEVIGFYTTYWPSQENVFKSPEEEKSYFQNGVKIIKDYSLKNDPTLFTVIDLETKFEVPLGEHILSGRIDRIDKLADDNLEIIDYKTNKRLPSQDDVNKNLQLSLYRLGITQRWPNLDIKDVKLSLYFLKHGLKISTRRDENELQETKEKVLEKIKKMEQGPYEPKVSMLCNWCSYKPICPAWSHLYKRDYEAQEVQMLAEEFLNIKEEIKTKEARLAAIRELIEKYFSETKSERAFGLSGYLALLTQKRYKYDFEKIKEVLEPLGKFNEVINVVPTLLRRIMPTVPEEERKKIITARILDKEFKIIMAEKYKEKEKRSG